MVIKVKAVSSSHGGAAIRYAMEKNAREGGEMPQFLYTQNVPVNDLTGLPTSPQEVFQAMRLRQAASGHNVKDSMWRIEICPPMEECRNWTDEQWMKCLKDAIRLLDAQDYINPKTGKVPMRTYKDKNGVNVTAPRVGRFKLSDCQLVATKHCDTDEWHIHVVANRITEHNEVMDSHKCETRAILAANAFADEYGWTRADHRENQRKEQMHADAIEVLKNMDTFDLKDYFRGLRDKGYIVKSNTPDKNGNIHGYRISERLFDNYGNPSSTVGFTASQLAHGKDLTVSRLYSTWQKVRNDKPEQKVSQQTAERPVQSKQQTPVVPKKSRKLIDEEYDIERLRKVKEEAERRMMGQPSRQREQTQGELDRLHAISEGLKVIKDFMKSPFKRDFYPIELEDILPEAVAAKAINMSSTPGGWREPGTFEMAAVELVGMLDISLEEGTAALEGVLSAVGDMLPPPVTPSAGGGGGDNSPWRKKDDDWEWWKKNGFTKKQRDNKLNR